MPLSLRLTRSIFPTKSGGRQGGRGDRCPNDKLVPWRICFEFRNGDAYDVEIVNYLKG
jgi:hypothetical protein